MTRYLRTRAQATRCIGVALGAAALLSLTTALSRADDGATAGVVAGAAAVGAYSYPGGCVQVVNAYGQLITRCR
jgi:hypothetical protein